MREESQLDEMRAAIRGDFQRLARRRGEQDLMRVAEPEPDPEAMAAEAEPGPVQAPLPEPEAQMEPTLAPGVSVPDDGEPSLQQTVASEVGEPTRRSWLDRLLGR